MTIRELITAALEKKGCSDVIIEEAGTDGGYFCWSITFNYEGKAYSGGWHGVDWLDIGPGVEIGVSAYTEEDDEAEWKITL